MTFYRVEFFIGATVEAGAKGEAVPKAKRELERRYGDGVVQVIEEQANAIVVFPVPPPDS